MSENFYNLLKVPFDATTEEIREGYFNAVKTFHPDINSDKDSEKKFVQIQEAYATLSIPAKRTHYDALLNFASLTQNSIKIRTYFSRTAIPRLAEKQMFYALVELECLQKVDINSLPPIQVCLIVDRSNSMRGERLEMVRSNILQLLKKLRPNDLVSLVTFSDRAEVILPLTKVGDIYAIEKKLLTIHPGGATEIFQGLETGYLLFNDQEKNNALKSLILITDGHTYGDEGRCLKLAENAWTEGVNISCMGIGYDWNDSFLDQLSAAGGGSCVYVQTSENLSNYLETKLSSIKESYANQIEIIFTPKPGVEVSDAFRILPEVAPLKTENPIPIGSLEYGNKTVFIIEFKIDPVQENAENIGLLDGKMTLDVPSNPVKQVRYKINWTLSVNEASLGDKPPVNILQAMSRLTLYRLQNRAKNDVVGGNYYQATKHLQYLATHLLSQGDRDLARAVLVEADHIHRTHQFSSEGEKRIKYGTRALLSLPIPEQQEK